MKLVATLIAAMFMASACATKPPVQKSNLTYANVKKNIVKGHTSQAEVIQLLGSANVISKNRSGNEVWTYSKQSSEQSSSGIFGGIGILGGSSAVSRSSANTFDLIVTFDGKDIVEDYSVVSSQF